MKSSLSTLLFALIWGLMQPSATFSQPQTYHLQPIVTADQTLVNQVVAGIMEYSKVPVVCRFHPNLNQIELLTEEPIDLPSALRYLESVGYYIADVANMTYPDTPGDSDHYFSLKSVKERWFKDHRERLNIPVHKEVLVLTELESIHFPHAQLNELLADGKAVIIN